MQKEHPSCLGERHGDVTSNGSLWSAHTVYTHLCQQLLASSFTPADRHVIFTPADRPVIFTPVERHVVFTPADRHVVFTPVERHVVFTPLSVTWSSHPLRVTHTHNLSLSLHTAACTDRSTTSALGTAVISMECL